MYIHTCARERKYERHNMSGSDGCVQSQSTPTSSIRVADQLIHILQGGTWALFGISVMAAIARTGIRIQMNRKLAIDDAFLLFACTCLTASFALLVVFTPAIFQGEAIVPNQPFVLLTSKSSQQLRWLQKVTCSNLALMWTVIFSIKFAFLSLFHTLVRRMRMENLYWKFVAGLTALAYAFCVCHGFVSCPQFNLTACRFRPCPRKKDELHELIFLQYSEVCTCFSVQQDAGIIMHDNES